MPTYEYACSNCGHHWEAEQRITADPLDTCPQCSQKTAKRQISGGGAFILKGGGWYTDLYSSAGKSAGSSSSSSSSSSGSSTSSSSSSSSDSSSSSSSGSGSGGSSSGGSSST